MNITSSNTGATLGKLLVGAFLHDFHEDGRSGPQMIQVASGKVRKYLGQEQAKELVEASEGAHLALINACIDHAIFEKMTDDTKKLISELDSASRILVEGMYLRLTGQEIISHREGGRWLPQLWRLRKICRKYLELSPTEVPEEDLLCTLKEVATEFYNGVRESFLKALQ